MQRLFKQEAKWYRAIIFAMIFMALPAIVEQSWTSYQRHYYQTEPIETFYQAISMEVGNVCLGDKTQHVDSVRFVYGTKTGWAADIVRDLYRIDDSERVKVHDEGANIFIEKVEDGAVSRETAIPEVGEGIYQWDITFVRLYLPYGVVRVQVPTLTSNVFAVEDCNKLAYGNR